MAFWIQLPLPVRLAVLSLVGVIAGGFVNWAIYAWATFRVPVSPWSRVPAGMAARHWFTRLPVVGWWARAAETPQQLAAARERLTRLGYEVPPEWTPRMPFWLRPMAIELALGFALPWLYWYETQAGLVLPAGVPQAAVAAAHPTWLHWMFVGHALLLVLMTIATFIDFDEQIIPDWVTIPGTLLALGMASVSLHTFLPIPLTANGVMRLEPCTFSAPWPVGKKWGSGYGLAVGLAMWSGWCFALSTRVLILRRGWKKAVVYFFAILRRDAMTKWLGLIWLMGLVVVVMVWNIGTTHWEGLFTALVGMSVGGGTIWAVRLVASLAMGEEAMGFGDVTLMAMIGGIVGWQATGAAFFIAPLTSIFIVLITFLATGQRMTPFGPYLCAGTVITVLYWPTVWQAAILPALLLGPVFLMIMVGSLVAMGVLLGIWRAIKMRLLAA
ncbi:A24 family peptidase [Roseimaritima ulvae]|uniref:Type IV leader peptidase family protein n=1 Tax=Roseimaritima ulvae TaxID=980254 RepID=A0A5B9R0J7_9BACT|nr:A24 family peptidase [Roseimaritima ulvae]QEG39781.1 Type IV leader peptidase family protein [Roseimaritima ulvae]